MCIRTIELHRTPLLLVGFSIGWLAKYNLSDLKKYPKFAAGSYFYHEINPVGGHNIGIGDVGGRLSVWEFDTGDEISLKTGVSITRGKTVGT